MVHRSENSSSSTAVINENNQSHNNNNNNGGNNTSATYLYYLMSNAMKATNAINNHDADSTDSGTCSEDTSPIPPPIPKKTNKSTKVLLNGSVTTVVENVRSGHVHFSDSDESVSSLSSIGSTSVNGLSTEQIPRVRFSLSYLPLPDSLLKDIRTTNTILRKATSQETETDDTISSDIVNENENGKITIKLQDLTVTNGQYKPQSILKKTNNAQYYDHLAKPHVYEDDKFYNFHINERDTTPETEDDMEEPEPVSHDSEETFAGFKEIQSGNSTIRSSKGTVRGVRNRVRNGITTFLKIYTSKVGCSLCFYMIFILVHSVEKNAQICRLSFDSIRCHFVLSMNV